MTTAKELIAHLQTLPEDTIIQVLQYDDSSYGYGGGTVNIVDLELPTEENRYPDTYTFVDFAGNQFVTPNYSFCNKKYLTLGDG